MVMKCERCQTEFKYESLLARHLARKKSCEKVEIKCNHCDVKCKYCKRPLSSNQSRNRHESVCKYKDDFVRNLELELDIEVDYDYSNTTCRFCDKTMHPNNLLRHESACKEKDVYKTKLQNMLKAHSEKQWNTTNNIQNNINVHNGDKNTINITLRPFGSENLDYITPSKILGLMKSGKCQFTGDAEKQRFLRLMCKFIHGNPEYPENHNMLIPSLKGSNALVYTEDGFEHIHRKLAENQVLTTISDVSYNNIALEHEDDKEEKQRLICKNNYERFVNKYIEGTDTYDDESDQRKNAQNRNTIAQTSYNCKDIIKDTHKNLDIRAIE